MRLVHWILTAAFLTASFDFLLVVNVGGTLHFAQVLMFPILLAALAWVVQHHTILWPRGGYALLLFTVFQGLLLFNSRGLISINLQLYALFVFTVLSLLAILQLYGRSVLVPSLFRLYLLSYVVIGAFGAVQFLMPIFHLGGLFVRQWIAYNRLARINGFNSEPSYFATYLIMGMIMLIDLRQTGARLTQAPVLVLGGCPAHRGLFSIDQQDCLAHPGGGSGTACFALRVAALDPVCRLHWRRPHHHSPTSTMDCRSGLGNSAGDERRACPS